MPTIVTTTTTELPKVINEEGALNRSQDDPRCKLLDSNSELGKKYARRILNTTRVCSKNCFLYLFFFQFPVLSNDHED